MRKYYSQQDLGSKGILTIQDYSQNMQKTIGVKLTHRNGVNKVFIMTVQPVNMSETYLYYNREKLLSFGSDLDAYMWQDYIGPRNLPRWTNELPNHLKWSQMIF